MAVYAIRYGDTLEKHRKPTSRGLAASASPATKGERA